MPEGLTVSDLECVMLDVPLMDIQKAVGEDLWNEDDLFYGDTPTLKYAQGAVAEEQAHLTLLFGIHPSDTYERDVLQSLHDWDMPDILINKVSYFPSREEGQNYICIIAEVVPSAALLAGRRNLEYLPYTSDFPDYKPHITLAYVRTDTGADTQGWIDALNSAFAHKFISFENVSLNLGLDD
jgi:2'-5' RNA ligase